MSQETGVCKTNSITYCKFLSEDRPPATLWSNGNSAMRAYCQSHHLYRQEESRQSHKKCQSPCTQPSTLYKQTQSEPYRGWDWEPWADSRYCLWFLVLSQTGLLQSKLEILGNDGTTWKLNQSMEFSSLSGLEGCSDNHWLPRNTALSTYSSLQHPSSASTEWPWS
jgi:hypothetical protein